MNAARLCEVLTASSSESLFRRLYGNRRDYVQANIERARKLAQVHEKAFPAGKGLQLFSSPGRTEVGGNHTDHNGGRVLAATVNVDILAIASPSRDGQILIDSEGFGRLAVDLSDLSLRPHPRKEEQFTSIALVKGVCAKLKELGHAVGGFHAVMNSTIPKAAGLSSSAAFECLITEIQNVFYNKGNIDPILNAQISQFSENTYFGKPCGLMDQTTIALGGLVTIDFKSFEQPLVRRVDIDFAKSGYALVVVDTGGNHADLNDDYIALEHEMKSVAKALGGQVLRDHSMTEVLERAPALRKDLGDRAILRAVHFYEDDQRVVDQVVALESRDFQKFLSLVIESGQSSFMYCQNCFVTGHPHEQGISLAVALSEQVLRGKGAWRVHGGGFAGTIQAFVPESLVPEYVKTLEAVFGCRSCYVLSIRQDGTRCVTL